jgi:hypothetical protein
MATKQRFVRRLQMRYMKQRSPIKSVKKPNVKDFLLVSEHVAMPFHMSLTGSADRMHYKIPGFGD